MQKRFQQFAGAALDSLGLSKIEDEQLVNHLRTLDETEKSLRDVEKASSEVYASFETTRESTSNVVSAATELLSAFDKDPVIRNTLVRFMNLRLTCDTSLDNHIKQRIEENIFAKLELRRDVLHSIHRRIEECSQLRSRYMLVFDNYMSMQEDKEALATLSEQEIGDMRDECDRLKVQLEQQRLQLDGDITNYITNTRQFILDCYTYLGSLSSLVNASMNTALTSLPAVQPNQNPPETATKETMNVVLKAGLSTIQSISVAKGEQVWWEISASGDIGFGVLFKKTSTEETGEKVAPETVEKIRRVDPAMEEIRGHMECASDGTIEFGFDNSFSYFRSKTIEIVVYRLK